MPHTRASSTDLDLRGAGLLSIDACERLLTRMDVHGQGTLLLPRRARGTQFGAMARLIQLVATWRRRNPDAPLVLPASTPATSPAHLPSLDFWYVALLMSGSVIAHSDAEASVAYQAARRRLQHDTRARDAGRGAKVLVLVADHLPQYGSLALYGSGPLGPARPPVSLSRPLVDDILAMTAGPKLSGAIDSQVRDDLAAALHELMVNTHDWAKSDFDGISFASSVRGIRAELYRHTKAVHLTLTDNRAMQDFIARAPDGKDGYQRFLEITVFDTGPGLAARALGRPLLYGDPILPEYNAVIQCLTKHSSSSMAPGRGQGLHRVMQLMTALRGFLMLRSGRLSLQRNFARDPYPDGEGLDDGPERPDLFDTHSQWGGGAVARSGVAGATISLIVPLDVA